MSWPAIADKILQTTIGAFGQPVTYTPSGGSPITINGVFDAAHSEVGMGSHVPGVSSVSPRLGIRLADLPAKPKKGDLVAIGATTYRVIDSEEDGDGGSTLRLQKQ